MITRRAFIGGLAAAPAIGTRALAGRFEVGPAGRHKVESAPAVSIDAAKLRERIEQLSVFGRRAGGTFADGVSRTAYSDADVAGRQYVLGEIRAAGLQPRIDPAGNIFATRAGADGSLRPILFGSHVDSVPNGGNFDGDLGSLAALGAMEALGRARVRTRHPLEMVIWAHEEGFAFGQALACSRIVAGQFKPSDLDAVWNGMTRADCLRKIGGNPDRIADAVRPKGAHHCYLELHIEQGGTLEKAKTPIGIVEGIVAIDKFDAVVTGFANHAGTTPIPDRQDAMLAASYLTIAVRDAVTADPGRQVGTVGHVEVTPNSPNVIPGLVKLSVELRDLSPEKLDRIADDIRARAKTIEANTHTSIELTRTMRLEPAAAAGEVQAAIGRAAEARGLASMRLPSGAGHDAQEMARLSPMGMIFVPSVGGISHSPKELTTWEDCAHGANVLAGAVLEMDAV